MKMDERACPRLDAIAQEYRVILLFGPLVIFLFHMSFGIVYLC